METARPPIQRGLCRGAWPEGSEPTASAKLVKRREYFRTSLIGTGFEMNFDQ